MGKLILEWNHSGLVFGIVGKQTASSKREGMGTSRNVVIPNRAEALQEWTHCCETAHEGPCMQNVTKRLWNLFTEFVSSCLSWRVVCKWLLGMMFFPELLLLHSSECSRSGLVCSVPSCHQPLVSPQLFVPLQCPLGCQGKPFDVTWVSFVTSKHQPAALHPLSCHFTAVIRCLRASNPKQRGKKGFTALGSMLVTKINVKTSFLVGWNYPGNADSLSIKAVVLTGTRNKTSALESLKFSALSFSLLLFP